MESYSGTAVVGEATLGVRVIRTGSRSERVVIEGALDLRSVRQFEALIEEELSAAAEIELDLSGIAFMDAAGIHALLAAAVRADEHGSALSIGGSLSNQVKRLLGLAGVLESLPLTDGAAPRNP